MLRNRLFLFPNFATMWKNVLIPGLMAVVLCACTEEKKSNCYEPATPVLPVTMQFESLEKSFATVQSKQDVVRLFEGREVLRDLFFNRAAYPDDSVFIRELYQRFSHPAFDTLASEVQRVFGDGSGLRKQFTDAWAHFRYYYPDAPMPKVVTVISGMENDLYLSDSLIIVGLDYFLDLKARFRPNVYDYMQRRYTPETLVPSIMLLHGIDAKRNKIDPNDQTALAEMVAYGKAYLFARHMIPCVPDSSLFGFTPREAAATYFNEAAIFKRLVDERVWFETSHLVKQRYLSERPNVPEISTECPGRIGTWVGMRIVQKYQEETRKDLKSIMEQTDANAIFRISKYKPVGN